MGAKLIATLLMLNLALFALDPTKAATSCPSLNVCGTLLGLSLNVDAFGSQSSSQCCTVLNGIGSVTEAANCLCSTIKSSLLSSTNVPPVLGGTGTGTPLLGGVLGGLPIVGGILDPLIGVVGTLPIIGTFLRPVIGGGGTTPSASSTATITPSQLLAPIFKGCGINTPATFTCA